MKYILIFSLLFSLSYANSLESIDFHSAVEKATQDDKIIMIMYEQDGCYACKKMNEETLENTELLPFIQENFHYVLINISHQKKLKGLTVAGTPTIFFINKNKKVLKRTVGAIKAKTFRTILDDILFKANNKNIEKIIKKEEAI